METKITTHILDSAEEITSAISCHDNPTIAFLIDEFPDYTTGEATNYLFKPKDELLIILREMDRLWMISPEGIEKDIMDQLRKKKTPKSPQEQLLYNLKRFEEEGELYKKFDKTFSSDYYFFRNKYGIEIFCYFLSYWMRNKTIKTDPDLNKIFHHFQIILNKELSIT